MGERGPQPKYSAEERKKQGNPGNRPDDVTTAPGNDLEPVDFFPQAPAAPPAPPGFLLDGTTENDPEAIPNKAVEIWNYLAAYVFEAKLLRDGDTASLGRLCRYLAEWDHLTKIIDDEGFVVKGGQGVQRHPALIARNALEAQIQKLESQFGLNPEDRLNLTKDFANSLRNLPLAGKSSTGENPSGDKRGPIGFLKKGKK